MWQNNELYTAWVIEYPWRCSNMRCLSWRLAVAGIKIPMIISSNHPSKVKNLEPKIFIFHAVKSTVPVVSPRKIQDDFSFRSGDFWGFFLNIWRFFFSKSFPPLVPTLNGTGFSSTWVWQFDLQHPRGKQHSTKPTDDVNHDKLIWWKSPDSYFMAYEIITWYIGNMFSPTGFSNISLCPSACWWLQWLHHLRSKRHMVYFQKRHMLKRTP